MRVLQAIFNEIKIATTMTFVEPYRAGKKHDAGWAKDRHLRNGFLIAAPMFFLAGLAINTNGQSFGHNFLPLLGCALVSNLIWFGYAAWSRSRSSRLPKD